MIARNIDLARATGILGFERYGAKRFRKIPSQTMHQNLHAYRNLGVACLLAKCDFCSKTAAQSVYFVLDSERVKRCTLGCTACGRSKPISETDYDALYEASYDYDSWREGTLGFEAYKVRLPEAFRALAEEKEAVSAEANWVCPQCGGDDSKAKGECLHCGYGKEAEEQSSGGVAQSAGSTELQQSKLPVIRLSNGLGPVLKFALSLGLATQPVLIGLIWLDLLPNLMGMLASEAHAGQDWGRWLWLPLGFGLALGLGVLMSYRRFPIGVIISAQGIRVRPRGSQVDIRLGFERLRQVRYRNGGKYLTLWLTDGKTYVVRITPSDTPALKRYFEMTG